MKFEIVEDGGSNQHLPDFARTENSGMLGSGLRHLGIVCDGEVVATVWNHHDATACREIAELIAARAEVATPKDILRQLYDSAPMRRWKEFEERGEERIPCFLSVESAKAIDEFFVREAMNPPQGEQK